MIIIIGAGLAGLTCAKMLTEADQPFLLLEAADQVGGRLRTDYHEEGFRLDRGFQILFTEYAAAKRHLHYDGLKLRPFSPGAIFARNGKLHEIGDPLREPTSALSGLFNPVLTPIDKVRLLQLRSHISKLSTSEIFSGEGLHSTEDETTEAYLRGHKFSDKFIEQFARPFYGSIFLDRSLQTSARMFQFVFKMLNAGDSILPALGIQRIPEQLAASLARSSIRFNARASKLIIEDEQVRGVILANGEKIEADQVVVATSSQDAARLVGDVVPELPLEGLGTVCLYFAGDERLYPQRKIIVNTDPKAYVNSAALITNIAPTYAPPRKHLLSVNVLGNPAMEDTILAERCLAELGTWFPNHNLKHWQLLAIYRLPFAQFSQPVGIYDRLPDNRTSVDGLYIAGEYTKSSSIQGAMHSGEYVARELLKQPHTLTNAEKERTVQ